MLLHAIMLLARCTSSNSTATSGTAFTGARFRTFTHVMESVPQELSSVNVHQNPRWIVITTINRPTKTIHKLVQLLQTGVCIVIVGDKRTPLNYTDELTIDSGSCFHFLSLEAQSQLSSQLSSIKHTPENHFGRKNIGYLFAIKRGAQYIYDTDDDNEPINVNKIFAKPAGTVLTVQALPSCNFPSWNVYKEFTKGEAVWPRGMALPYIKSPCGVRRTAMSAQHVGVWQVLANLDPDVDAIYRLTQPLPITFETKRVVAIDRSLMVPFNAQATLWTHKAFYCMYLPLGIHGRVADIWRSYICQALFRTFGGALGFVSPNVNQFRNAHDLMRDFQSELQLYLQTEALVGFLKEWSPAHNSSNTEGLGELYKELYSRGFVEHSCVVGAMAWIADLKNGQRKIAHTTLLGQFNWNTSQNQLKAWRTAWSGVVTGPLHPYVPNGKTGEGSTPYAGDMGWFSPYHNLATELRGTTVGDAVLYAHDDLLVAHDTVRSLGTEWASTDHVRFPYFEKDEHWFWWDTCKDSLQGIIKNGTVESIINTPLILDGPNTFLHKGQSDMLYVKNNNATINAIFCDLLDAFYKHKLFLECAIPTALHIMRHHYGVAVRTLTLCTDWSEHVRTNMTRAPCYTNKFDVLHPVKNDIFVLAANKMRAP